MHLAFEDFPARDDGKYFLVVILVKQYTSPTLVGCFHECRISWLTWSNVLSRLMLEPLSKLCHYCTMILILCFCISYFVFTW